MDLFQADAPVFEKRVERDKYQVRFWSSPDLYDSFTVEVEKNDLLIQDVFNQFMEWFAAASQQGSLPTRTVAPRKRR